MSILTTVQEPLNCPSSSLAEHDPTSLPLTFMKVAWVGDKLQPDPSLSLTISKVFPPTIGNVMTSIKHLTRPYVPCICNAFLEYARVHAIPGLDNISLAHFMDTWTMALGDYIGFDTIEQHLTNLGSTQILTLYEVLRSYWFVVLPRVSPSNPDDLLPYQRPQSYSELPGSIWISVVKAEWPTDLFSISEDRTVVSLTGVSFTAGHRIISKFPIRDPKQVEQLIRCFFDTYATISIQGLSSFDDPSISSATSVTNLTNISFRISDGYPQGQIGPVVAVKCPLQDTSVTVDQWIALRISPSTTAKDIHQRVRSMFPELQAYTESSIMVLSDKVSQNPFAQRTTQLEGILEKAPIQGMGLGISTTLVGKDFPSTFVFIPYRHDVCSREHSLSHSSSPAFPTVLLLIECDITRLSDNDANDMILVHAYPLAMSIKDIITSVYLEILNRQTSIAMWDDVYKMSGIFEIPRSQVTLIAFGPDRRLELTEAHESLTLRQFLLIMHADTIDLTKSISASDLSLIAMRTKFHLTASHDINWICRTWKWLRQTTNRLQSSPSSQSLYTRVNGTYCLSRWPRHTYGGIQSFVDDTIQQMDSNDSVCRRVLMKDFLRLTSRYLHTVSAMQRKDFVRGALRVLAISDGILGATYSTDMFTYIQELLNDPTGLTCFGHTTMSCFLYQKGHNNLNFPLVKLLDPTYDSLAQCLLSAVDESTMEDIQQLCGHQPTPYSLQNVANVLQQVIVICTLERRISFHQLHLRFIFSPAVRKDALPVIYVIAAASTCTAYPQFSTSYRLGIPTGTQGTQTFLIRHERLTTGDGSRLSSLEHVLFRAQQTLSPSQQHTLTHWNLFDVGDRFTSSLPHLLPLEATNRCTVVLRRHTSSAHRSVVPWSKILRDVLIDVEFWGGSVTSVLSSDMYLEHISGVRVSLDTAVAILLMDYTTEWFLRKDHVKNPYACIRIECAYNNAPTPPFPFRLYPYQTAEGPTLQTFSPLLVTEDVRKESAVICFEVPFTAESEITIDDPETPAFSPDCDDGAYESPHIGIIKNDGPLTMGCLAAFSAPYFRFRRLGHRLAPTTVVVRFLYTSDDIKPSTRALLLGLLTAKFMGKNPQSNPGCIQAQLREFLESISLPEPQWRGFLVQEALKHCDPEILTTSTMGCFSREDTVQLICELFDTSVARYQEQCSSNHCLIFPFRDKDDPYAFISQFHQKDILRKAGIVMVTALSATRSVTFLTTRAGSVLGDLGFHLRETLFHVSRNFRLQSWRSGSQVYLVDHSISWKQLQDTNLSCCTILHRTDPHVGICKFIVRDLFSQHELMQWDSHVFITWITSKFLALVDDNPQHSPTSALVNLGIAYANFLGRYPWRKRDYIMTLPCNEPIHLRNFFDDGQSWFAQSPDDRQIQQLRMHHVGNVISRHLPDLNILQSFRHPTVYKQDLKTDVTQASTNGDIMFSGPNHEEGYLSFSSSAPIAEILVFKSIYLPRTKAMPGTMKIFRLLHQLFPVFDEETPIYLKQDNKPWKILARGSTFSQLLVDRTLTRCVFRILDEVFEPMEFRVFPGAVWSNWYRLADTLQLDRDPDLLSGLFRTVTDPQLLAEFLPLFEAYIQSSLDYFLSGWSLSKTTQSDGGDHVPIHQFLNQYATTVVYTDHPELYGSVWAAMHRWTVHYGTGGCDPCVLKFREVHRPLHDRTKQLHARVASPIYFDNAGVTATDNPDWIVDSHPVKEYYCAIDGRIVVMTKYGTIRIPVKTHDNQDFYLVLPGYFSQSLNGTHVSGMALYQADYKLEDRSITTPDGIILPLDYTRLGVPLFLPGERYCLPPQSSDIQAHLLTPLSVFYAHQNQLQRLSRDVPVHDSGCTMSLSADKSHFTHMVPCVVRINTASKGTPLYSESYGLYHLLTGPPELTIHCAFKAFYVPDIARTLISQSQLLDDGHRVIFDKKELGVYFKHVPDTLCPLLISEDLFIFPTKDDVFSESLMTHSRAAVDQHAFLAGAKLLNQIELFKDLHMCFGHASGSYIAAIPEVIQGLGNKKFGKLILNGTLSCTACAQGKIRAVSHKHAAEHRGHGIFSLIHIDALVMPTRSIDNHNYFYAMVCDKTKYCIGFPNVKKSEFLDNLQRLHAYIRYINATRSPESHSVLPNDYELTTIRTDNDKVHSTPAVVEFCRTHNIFHEKSTPYISPQNGVAERTLRTLTEMTRTSMLAANLPAQFWHYAMLNSV